MSALVAWGLVAGVVLGLGLWMLASLAPRLNRPRLIRRVAPYLVDISADARESLTPAPPGPLPVLGVLVAPFATRARSLLGGLLGGDELVARRLRQAGSGVSVEEFRARQLAWGLVGAIGGATLALIAVGTGSTPLPLAVAMVGVSAVAGEIGRAHV